MRTDNKEIMLDDILQIILQHFLTDQFPINKIVQKIISLLTPAVVIQTREGKQIIHRNKLPSIDLKVQYAVLN